MAVNPDAAFSRGDVMRRLADLERAVRGLATARRLESSTIGAGGLIVQDDGMIRVMPGSTGGEIRLQPGFLSLFAGGIMTVFDEGRIQTLHGGLHLAYYASGVAAIGFGTTKFPNGTLYGHGIIVQRDTTGADILQAVQLADGRGVVYAGQAGAAADEINLYGENSIIESTTDPLRLIGDASFRVYTSYANTASAANCFLDATTGQIMRSTSSRRGKTDIVDLNVDPAAVLRARPRMFRDAPGVRGGGPTNPRGSAAPRLGKVPVPGAVVSDDEPVAPLPAAAEPVEAPERPLVPGFIAEELDEIGLGQFVIYDAQGEPEGIAYDRLTAALLVVLKDQQRRIEALEAQNAVPRPS